MLPEVPDTDLLFVKRFAHVVFQATTSHLGIDGVKAKNSLAQIKW